MTKNRLPKDIDAMVARWRDRQSNAIRSQPPDFSLPDPDVRQPSAGDQANLDAMGCLAMVLIFLAFVIGFLAGKGP